MRAVTSPPVYCGIFEQTMSRVLVAFLVLSVFIVGSIASQSLIFEPPTLLPKSFSDASTVTSLKIRNYQLKSFDENQFQGFKVLKMFNMTNNNFGSLNGTEFVFLGTLEVLNLRHNNITIIPSNEFNELTQLKFLYLDENSLTRIDKKTFANNVDLEVISMSTNDIESLHYKTFATLSKLRELDLSLNRLSRLQAKLFRENNNLKKLDVSSNVIIHVESSFFADLKSIERADFEGNPCMTEYISSSNILKLNDTITASCRVSEEVKHEWMIEELEELREENAKLKTLTAFAQQGKTSTGAQPQEVSEASSGDCSCEDYEKLQNLLNDKENELEDLRKEKSEVSTQA